MVIRIRLNHVRHESRKVVFTLIELETGADSLTKPFEMKGLKVRIHHLIEVRKNSWKNSAALSACRPPKLQCIP